MAGKSTDAKALATQLVGPEAVEAYLENHPSFLADRPALMELLTPPERRQGDGVVDLQRFMVDRLRGRVRALEDEEKRLHALGAANLAAQERTHAAALALLAARSFAHLIEVATGELPALLEVEAAALCVEAGEGFTKRDEISGVRLLKPGAIDRLVGRERPIALIADAPGSRLLFGAAHARVRSSALARLGFGPGSPPGLLALGAARPDGYAPDQGTELLAFLARIVAHCIRRWLILTPAP